jgi:hypothetical protein
MEVDQVEQKKGLKGTELGNDVFVLRLRQRKK